MTVDELRTKGLEIISALQSSDFNNIDSGITDKLDELSVAAEASGMKEGKRLMENLAGAIKSIKEGKSQANSGSVRLTALDFYIKNLPNNESIEDL
jgi:alpha-D-ribose 1-methylphosphonate 5-triphosphate diphosphatase PhnM